ncbi:hypothetical protein JCM8097_008124 [Rhodosporidiobolus ruineniae]
MPELSSSSGILISPSLSSLPPELKLKIAEEVAAFKSHPFLNLAPGEVVAPEKLVADKMTLAALSRTSREWHTLTVPFLFEAFTLTRKLVLSSDYLFHSVLEPYGHLVRSLIVGQGVIQSPLVRSRMQAIVDVVPNLASLSLSCDFPESLPVLSRPAPITSLNLKLYQGYPSQAFLDPFVATLETLRLSTAPVVNIEPPAPYVLPHVTTLELDYSNPPYFPPFARLPLEHLSFRSLYMYRDLLSETRPSLGLFLNQLKPTIRSLVFQWPNVSITASKYALAEDTLDGLSKLCKERGIEVVLPNIKVVETPPESDEEEDDSDDDHDEDDWDAIYWEEEMMW